MLTTKRLFLRRVRMEDLQDLHLVFSNPDAMLYWDSLPYESMAQTEKLLSAMTAALSDESDDFVIEYNGRVIGKAGCWRCGEIGYILHPDFWGKGLAHEALSAVIPHNFEHLPIDRLVADVDPRNAASLKLLDRLGFTEFERASRTLLIGDEWCDSIYLELPRPS